MPNVSTTVTGPALFFCLLLLAVPVFAETVKELQTEFLLGHYEAVLRYEGQRSDEVLFLQGASAIKLRNLELARTNLESLLKDYPKSARVPQAQQLLGEVERLAKPAPPPPVVEAAAPEPEPAIAVQVGAFASETNARKLQSHLAKRGYSASVLFSTDSGYRLFKVRVGRFAKQGEAEEQAKKLRSEGFPAKVVP
jgi:hypothetical protein